MASSTPRSPAHALQRSWRIAGLVWLLCVAVLFRDTIGFLFEVWRREEYSYGLLIPVVTLFLIWQRWPEMRQRGFRFSITGLLPIAAGLFAFSIASGSGSPILAAWALLLVLGGTYLVAIGRSAFRLALAPLALSALAIPLPEFVHSTLSSLMTRVAAELGAALMRLAGTSVLLHDGILDLGKIQYVVDTTASGLNTLFPLLAIALISAFFLRGSLWLRAVFVLSTFPISILMNAVHLALTAVLADRYGIDRVTGFLSLLDGWIIFMACTSLLLIEAWLLLRLSGDLRPLLETLDFDLVQHRPAPKVAARSEAGSRGKLLLVASNFAPELTGIGKYLGDMAAWLSQAGFEIRVVTAPPYYPAWRVPAGYSSRHYMTQYLGGIRVIRCPLLVPRRPRGLTRLLHMLSFAASTFPVVIWQALSWRPNLVFVVEPPLGCAPAAWIGARLSGARAWLHGLPKTNWIRLSKTKTKPSTSTPNWPNPMNGEVASWPPKEILAKP